MLNAVKHLASMLLRAAPLFGAGQILRFAQNDMNVEGGTLCHAERSEASGSGFGIQPAAGQILRFAQNDIRIGG
jgi:hypothetical protein